jgi:hypothetical protein
MATSNEGEQIMMNYVTKREYTGKNAEILSAAGVDAVITFKQAVRDLGIPGSKLKGLKACAKLVMFTKDEEENEKKPRFFSVFDATEVLARA